MSVEAMKKAHDLSLDGNHFAARQVLMEAIEQAEKQEPVAWYNPDESTLAFKKLRGDWHPLYTALPQREWVGLTDEEWLYIWDEADTDMWIQNGREDAERMINAKLKEKNHVD
jgi:hypothetical protein